MQFALRAYKCDHPALTHRIVNSPNPNSTEHIVDLPNGTSARLVILGDKIDESLSDSPAWWPKAQSPTVRGKLFRRIVAEGRLLPVVYATTLAMVSQIYTTTAVPESQPTNQVTGRRRVRLKYGRSPIADIGIAKGPCTRVTAQDRLAYYKMDTDDLLTGQDPTDHYWIYLTTLNGQEIFLDCGMFTFNFTIMTDVSKYVGSGLPPITWVPAYFHGKELEQGLPTTTGRPGWKPDKKFSILRSVELQDVLRINVGEYCEHHDFPTLYSVMDKIAGRTCTTSEKELMITLLKQSSMLFCWNLENREYRNFPVDPILGLDLDPQESVASTFEGVREDEACEKYLKKWTRKLKKGKITSKQWDTAFNAWGSNRNNIIKKMVERGEISKGN